MDEREKAEEVDGELTRSGKRFRPVLQSLPDVVAIVEPGGVLLCASPSVEEVLGYGPDELLGWDVFGYVHPEDSGRVRETLWQAVKAGGYGALVEYRFRHKDGSWRYLESAGGRLCGGERSDGVLVVSSRDVTGRAKSCGCSTAPSIAPPTGSSLSRRSRVGEAAR